jgi:hypothetical protein
MALSPSSVPRSPLATNHIVRNANDNMSIEMGPIADAARIESHQVETGDVEKQVGSDVIDWQGLDDPEKPVNWSNARKVKNIRVIWYNTFLTCANLLSRQMAFADN